MDICCFGQSARLSEAVITGGFMFLPGIIPESTEADVKDQTQDMLTQIDHWPEEHGSDKAHIPETTVLLADVDGCAAMNKVWDEWIAVGRAPAQTYVQARLADSHWAMKVRVSAVQAV